MSHYDQEVKPTPMKHVPEVPILDSSEMEETDTHFFRQYSMEGEFIFPAGNTLNKLTAGLYTPAGTARGTALIKRDFQTSHIIRYENSISEMIFNEFEKFWKLKDKYEERGESHKRGFLLWGPPGGGKTSLVMAMVSDFINKSDGLVLIYHPEIENVINFIRAIEPDRKMILLFEDIDSIISNYGEHSILSILDGEVKLVNTVVVATTNYPENLPDRIRNRPSRFDRVSEIGNPSYDQRYIYFEQKNTTNLSKKELTRYAKDTEEFSFAHLKELLTATEVYEYAYEETIDRLKSMQKSQENSGDYIKKIRSSSGARNQMGFQ